MAGEGRPSTAVVIAFVQPFGLHAPGGGPRILRTLLKRAPEKTLSVCTTPGSPPDAGDFDEIHLPSRPLLRPFEVGAAQRASGLADLVWAPSFRRRLRAALDGNAAIGIHGLAHGTDFWYAFRVAQETRRPYYLSIHDELGYAMQGRPERRLFLSRLARVWRDAEARFVISRALGDEYSRRFGTRRFQVVSDGVDEFATRARVPGRRRNLYFMGLFHHGYGPTATAMTQALELWAAAEPGLTIAMTLRSGHARNLSPASSGRVDILPFGSDEDVRRDMKSADLLYMPLPFEPRYRDFVRFSISTKMVSYLASGIPIVFHGPLDSAAGRLLLEHDAALVIPTLDPRAIVDALRVDPDVLRSRTENALALARREYSADRQRELFWSEIQRYGRTG